MNTATADAVETMRQLQKLSRELQPVKTALAALTNREKSTPNYMASAQSLDKIANRVAEVSRKYEAYIERATVLLERELPQLQRMTPIMECETDPPVTPLGSKTKRYKHSESSAAPTQGPFDNVCSPAVPYLLNPENYRMTRERICMQIEIVDYLIATERYLLAYHVAKAYGIPLFWFPKLVAVVLPPLSHIQSGAGGDKGRDSSLPPSMATSPFLTAAKPEEKTLMPSLTPEYIAIQCIKTNHSVVEAIAYCEEKILPLIERLGPTRGKEISNELTDVLMDLHAIRLLQIFRDGRTDHQCVVQYIATHLLPHATRRPLFVQHIINAVTQGSKPYDQHSPTSDTGRSATVSQHDKRKAEEEMRIVAGLISVEGFHKLAVTFHRLSSRVGSQSLTLCESLVRGDELGVDGGDLIPFDSPHTLPDLVTRVLATAIFLKDEYLERMVLERRASAPADAGPSSAPKIPANHLNTQSGSAAFDQAMMTIIEEILRKQNSSFSSAADGDGKKREALLSADELLKAEERWSNDVLFIKRPTRFYCYHTMECLDGGSGGNYPIALPNGTVVSKIAVMQCCMKRTGDGDNISTVVVCPRTKEEFPVASLKRIYVT